MSRKSTKWVSTSELAQALGCSSKYLLKQKGKLFKKGEHYRNIAPAAWRPTYRWNQAAIEKLLS